MEKNWYYAVDGVRSGPVTLDELRGLAEAGAVKRADLVWQPEFGAEWRSAGEVRDLFAPDEPPVPPAPEEGAEPDVPLLGTTGMRPSGLDAVSQAFGRMVSVLFRPFDITRWFSIGFCAWLAHIGTGASYNFNQRGAGSLGSFKQQFDQALDKCVPLSADLTKISVVAVAVLFVLLFALLFCKLRSRGDFMFVHRWYRPDATIGQCWWASRAASVAGRSNRR